MEARVPGFLYELDNVQGGKQPIQFVHTEFHKVYQKNVIIMDGTTDEEVLKMLIEKTEEDNKTDECDENTQIIKRLKLALQKAEEKTARKKKDAENSQLSLNPAN